MWRMRECGVLLGWCLSGRELSSFFSYDETMVDVGNAAFCSSGVFRGGRHGLESVMTKAVTDYVFVFL